MYCIVSRPCVSFAVFADHWRRRRWPVSWSVYCWPASTSATQCLVYRRHNSTDFKQSSMLRLVSSPRDVDETISPRCSCSFVGCVSLRGLNTSFAWWYITAYTVWLLITWPAGSNACPMSWLGDICVRWQHHNWSYPPRTAVQHSGDRAFPVAAACAYNALTHPMASASTLPTFSRLLKTDLFHRSFYS